MAELQTPVCQYGECSEPAVCGFEGTSPCLCEVHKLDGMVVLELVCSDLEDDDMSVATDIFGEDESYSPVKSGSSNAGPTKFTRTGKQWVNISEMDVGSVELQPVSDICDIPVCVDVLKHQDNTPLKHLKKQQRLVPLFRNFTVRQELALAVLFKQS